jgi:hypothetical protein
MEIFTAAIKMNAIQQKLSPADTIKNFPPTNLPTTNKKLNPMMIIATTSIIITRNKNPP